MMQVYLRTIPGACKNVLPWGGEHECTHPGVYHIPKKQEYESSKLPLYHQTAVSLWKRSETHFVIVLWNIKWDLLCITVIFPTCVSNLKMF